MKAGDIQALERHEVVRDEANKNQDVEAHELPVASRQTVTQIGKELVQLLLVRISIKGNLDSLKYVHRRSSCDAQHVLDAPKSVFFTSGFFV